ncbi:tetratricopeptide repeat protein [Arthrobacter globiformis]|uniref:tetratricopeptide repeat protein n=1 Tax=Arthrobacter globiformis TaxID=1665 RepID=UPI00397C016F
MSTPNPEPVDFRSSVELILSDDPDGLFNAANDLTQISKSEAIEVLYLLAIEHGVTEAYLNYGWFLRDINRPKEALAQFHKALELGDPQAAYYLGETSLEMGKNLEAIKWLRLAGGNPFLPLRLAKAYRAVGDELSAVEVLREGCETSPEAAVELIHTTNDLDLDAAINLLEKHLENGEVGVLIVLADLYSKTGNTQKEIELLRRSVAEGEPNALHNLGFALWNSGQVREGRALLKKAAQQGDKLSPKVLRKIRGKQRHGRRYKPGEGPAASASDQPQEGNS